VTFDDADNAVPVARALASGGVGIIEVALRTDAALAAIEAIRSHVPGMLVGAGTLRRPDDFTRAEHAGAQFAVSPGTTEELLKRARSTSLPFLPGASTVSEIMRLCNAGYDVVKFFPAQSLGGPAALAAIGGPLPDVCFCPSGGIQQADFMSWLQLDNVISVGGSWLAPADALGNWQRIEQTARDTMAQLQRDGS